MARSSTESKLMGVYNVLPQVLWMKQFLEEQGWLDSATMVYQDNTKIDVFLGVKYTIYSIYT